MRTNDGDCDAVWMVSPVSVSSATETNGSSGTCSTCWLRKVCSNTCSASAKAFAASPRRRWKSSAMLVSFLPLRCLRSGNVPAGLSSSCTTAFEVIASTSSNTAGSSSYSASISVRRLLRDVRIGGEHHRHRLADIVHLAVGEDRLVVEGRAVERIGDDLLDVVDGDHAIDAGQRARRADTSSDLMRPCATVLRKIFPISIFGRRSCARSRRGR